MMAISSRQVTSSQRTQTNGENMSRKTKTVRAAVGGAAAAILVAVGVGGYNIANGLTASSSSGAESGPMTRSTAPPSSASALRVTTAFLSSWHSGADEYAQAANSTNDPTGAESDLQNYRAGLRLVSINFTNVAPGEASASDPGATVVNFTVSAHVAGGTWTYPSTLNVIQNNAGFASVDWSQTVLFFGLTPHERLVAGPLSASGSSGQGQGVQLVDSDGAPVSTLAVFPARK